MPIYTVSICTVSYIIIIIYNNDVGNIYIYKLNSLWYKHRCFPKTDVFLHMFSIIRYCSCHMCQGLNSHYFHIIGDGHQPNNRVLYPNYKDSYCSGGRFPIPNTTSWSTLAHTYISAEIDCPRLLLPDGFFASCTAQTPAFLVWMFHGLLMLQNGGSQLECIRMYQKLGLVTIPFRIY